MNGKHDPKQYIKVIKPGLVDLDFSHSRIFSSLKRWWAESNRGLTPANPTSSWTKRELILIQDLDNGFEEHHPKGYRLSLSLILDSSLISSARLSCKFPENERV
jgi:hypothetical protein